MSKKRKKPSRTVRERGRPVQLEWRYPVEKIGLLLALVVVWYAAYSGIRVFYSSVYEFKAKNLINTARAPEAEAAAIKSIVFNKDNGYAHYYLGAYYYGQGRFGNATAQLTQALETIAHPATPLLLLAEMNLLQKNYDEALEYYNRTFKMNPLPHVEPGKRWYSYGKAAANAEVRALAIDAFQHALNLEFRSLDIYQSLGAQLFRMRLPIMAIQAFEQQILQSPAQAQPYIDLATVLRETRRYEEGVRFFSKMARAGIDRPEIPRYLAIFHMQVENYEAAEEILVDMEQKYPGDRTTTYLLGQLYYDMKNKEKATRYLEKFLDMNPTGRARQRVEMMLEEIASW